MGIISIVSVKHEQNFQLVNNGRTESASKEIKWQSLINQEKYYKNYYNINLKLCRMNVRLANNSWNGAVLGYLYD